MLIGRLPRGPCRALGRAYQHLIFHLANIADRGQLLTGLWTSDHRMLLSRPLGNCALREGNRTLVTLSTWATTGSHNYGTGTPNSPTTLPGPRRPPPRARLPYLRGPLTPSPPARPGQRTPLPSEVHHPPGPHPALWLPPVSGDPTPLLLPREATQHLAA